MAEAGWFRDSQDPNSEIYFDGQNWTSYRRPALQPPPPAAPPAGPPAAPQTPSPAENRTEHYEPANQQPAPNQPMQNQPGQNPPVADQPTWTTPAWGAPPTPAAPQWQSPAAPSEPTQWLPAPAPNEPTQWLPPASGGEWGAPAPDGGWGPPPGGGPWTPGAPPPRKRRKPLLLVLAAVVLLAAGLVTWLAWPSDDAPSITFAGKPIDQADKVLTTAEQRLQAYVKSHHGVQNGQTRCYFSRPATPSTGAKKTDVEEKLTCGPVLFVDGDATKPYVTIPVNADTAAKKAALTIPTELSELTPEAAPTSAKLERPDGQQTPSGAGGLKVPSPPPADKNLLTIAPLGPTPAPKSLTGARVVSKTTGFQVDAAGEVPRYGVGVEARSAPAGYRLIAFQLHYVAGDVSLSGSTSVMLVVNGGAPRPVNPADGDEWVIAAAPESGTAVLRMDQDGYVQTLSLPDGKPDSHNLAVLARTHRTTAAFKSVSIPVRVSNGNGSANLTLHARMSFASLDFWAPGHESVHAPDGAHALLTANVTYTRSGSSSVFGLEPALVHLRLPNGQTVPARNLASGDRIFNVYTVPASFTTGTVIVSGSERVDGVTLQIKRTTAFPVSIPAG